MSSRREFLTTMAAGLGAPRSARLQAADGKTIKSPLNGPIGLQLWSLREYLPKDLSGTLAKVRAMGFTRRGGRRALGQDGARAARRPRRRRPALHVAAHRVRARARRRGGRHGRGQGARRELGHHGVDPPQGQVHARGRAEGGRGLQPRGQGGQGRRPALRLSHARLRERAVARGHALRHAGEELRSRAGLLPGGRVPHLPRRRTTP